MKSRAVCLACLAALLLSLCPAGALSQGAEIRNVARTLAARILQTAATVKDISLPASPPEPTEPPILERFLPILERNPYCVGWIRIDGTLLDDPVLYTPADQNYFLRRDLDGNSSIAGTLFLAVPWREENNSALIYGHNMKSGQRFGGLLQYADKDFGLAHSVLRFDTLHREGTYRLLGAFYSQVYEAEDIESSEDRATKEKNYREAPAGEIPPAPWNSDFPDLRTRYPEEDIYREEKDIRDGKFRYYWFSDLSDRADFEYYVAQVKAARLYDTGADVQWGDRLLTLSTCAYHTANGRFVAVWVEEDPGA